MTQVFHTIAGVQCFLQSAGKIGFVPTMGALHLGHLSLIQRAQQENDCVVVSIFVNPLQFVPGEDYDRYPRTWNADLEFCQAAGVQALFAPAPEAVVPLVQVVPPVGMTQVLCGPFRPGHFTGVCTIVAQLLQIIRPDRIYLGQKDGQQVAILRQLIESFHFPVAVVCCPTVRASSGLALSSRNQYLDSTEQATAALLYQALQQAALQYYSGERQSQKLIRGMHALLSQNPLIRVQYIECVDAYTLTPLEMIMDGACALLSVAGYVNETRLIDNVLLKNRRPIVAIDGPAGAGKSTIAQKVAHRLSLLYLDTGAMYRGITWAVLEAGVALDNLAAIAEVASQVTIDLTPDAQVRVNGEDVTQTIRTERITQAVSYIATLPSVRSVLLREQQSFGQAGGVVMEGRDIGTQVFPDAEVKIFLTASVEQRAKRRQQDLAWRNLPVPALETIEQQIRERDYQDTHRAIAPLRQAEDATLVNSDHLTIEEVVERVIGCYQAIAV